MNTIFGTYDTASKSRLDLTYDYETCAIISFRQIAEHLRCSAVIDVGANIGVYSVFTGSLPSVKQVHAFEPAPEAFRNLRANIALQPEPQKFHCHNVAASHQQGSVDFNMVSPMSGANSVITDPTKAGVNRITVEAKTVDSVIPMTGERVAIKIDVEGYEEYALQGIIQMLVNNDSYVQIECLEPKKLALIEDALQRIGLKRIFRLRDDYIFLSAGLLDEEKAVLEILFANLADDLKDLLELRTKKRSGSSALVSAVQNMAYTRDPILR